MSQLFSPITLGQQTFINRIVVAPMCQYSADDGSANDWHLQHWAQLGIAGAGLVVVEATAVERRGRITHGCLGLYSDANERALERALHAARKFAAPGVKFGIQIGHAGRKASCQRPWEGDAPLSAAEDAWETFGPSPIPFSRRASAPTALTEDDMARIQNTFVLAAQRAVRLGFEAIELHAAHGYLLHQFLSPLSNRREDQYGGSFENRLRFPLAVATAVRAAVPTNVVLGARITGTDWDENGVTEIEAVAFAAALKKIGIEYACVSSGGMVPFSKIPVGPNYQVPLAERVKKEAHIATRAVGLITGAQQAEEIIASGQADMVALARAFLHDPRWPWYAANALGVEIKTVPQYERALPQFWPAAKTSRTQ